MRRISPQLLAYGKPPSCSTRGKASIVASKSTSAPPSVAVSTPPLAAVAPNRALNPPATTRPPALTLPQKDGAVPLYKYYFNVGKAYLTFYKTGLKGIYTNYRTANALPSRSFHPLFASRGTLFAAALTKKLSRADLQLLLRLRADTKVLPIFALVFVCCGEFTPLLVPWLTAIVPPSVHIPSQTNKLRRNAEKRRQQARAEGPQEWRSIENIWDLKVPRLDDKLLLPVVRRVARELALYPPWWENLPLHMSLVKHRLRLRLNELRVDDMAIMRDGGVRGMMAEEVTIACERRGLAVEGKGEVSLRKMLKQWLEEGNSGSAKELTSWLIGRRVD